MTSAVQILLTKILPSGKIGLMNIDKRLLHLVRSAPIRFCVSLFTGTMGGIFTLLQAFILSLIITEIFLNNKSIDGIRIHLLGFLIILIVRSILTFLQNINTRLLAHQVKTNLRNAVANQILKLGPVFTENTQTGALATTAMQGIENLEDYFTHYLPQLFFAAVIPTLILILIFPLDLLTGIIFLLTAPLIPIFMVLIGKTSERLTKKQWITLQRLGAHFLDTIQTLKTLKLLNQSKAFNSQISEVSEKYRQATLNVLKVTFLSAFVLEMVSTLSTAIVAVQIGLRLLNGGMAFQQALFILIIAPEFYLPLRTLGIRFHSGMTGVNAANSIFSLLDHPKPLSMTAQKMNNPLLQNSNSVSFSDVSFTYPGRSQRAVRDISFEFRFGEFIALVGLSGAGKSTIFNLLLRFIEPDQGQITFNNDSLSAFEVNAWRKLIAWVPQKPFIFHGDIAENIHMGEKGHKEGILKASISANLHEFIQSLPDGYNTILGERGQQLSSGQAQRLAIARAFYKKAPVLLMDEPISRLDPINQAYIQDSIHKLRTEHTIVMIAHQIETIRNADRVLFMMGGRLIGDDNHRNLVSKNDQYRLFTSETQSNA